MLSWGLKGMLIHIYNLHMDALLKLIFAYIRYLFWLMKDEVIFFLWFLLI